MHSTFDLCQRALTFVRLVASRAVGAVTSLLRPLSGKGFRRVLLVGAPLAALTVAVFGYAAVGQLTNSASASAPRHGHGAGPHDWWGSSVGSASPVGSFIDDAARNEWYATLLFINGSHQDNVKVVRTSGGGHYAHGSSTGACGGATNGADQYIGRESGGDPGAVNSSSGAYGCYQIMPSTWGASCSDLGPQSGSSASTQAQCASRLPASAWAG